MGRSMGGESGDNKNDELDYVKWHECETAKEIDFQEAGEISLEIDLNDRVMHIDMSDNLFLEEQ